MKKIKLLSISLDQSLLSSNSLGDTAIRFKHYSKFTQSYTVIVPTTKLSTTATSNAAYEVVPVCGRNLLHAYLKLIPKIINLCNRKQINLVVTNDPHLTFFAIYARRFTQRSFAIQTNVFGTDFHYPYWYNQKLLYRFLRYLDIFALNHTDTIRTDNSHDARLLIQQYGLPKSKITTIPISPSPEYITKLSSTKKARTVRYSLLSVGTLILQKDFLNLLEAIKLVVSKFPSLKLTIIGEGSEYQKLKHFITKHGLESSVVLAGKVPYAQIVKYYQQNQYYILSSAYEGLPRVIMEAALSGMPIITTNAGGVGDIVKHKQSGLVVPTQDPKKLARAIIYALENPKSMKKYALQAKAITLDLLNFDRNLKRLAKSWQRTIQLHNRNL